MGADLDAQNLRPYFLQTQSASRDKETVVVTPSWVTETTAAGLISPSVTISGFFELFGLPTFPPGCPYAQVHNEVSRNVVGRDE